MDLFDLLYKRSKYILFYVLFLSIVNTVLFSTILILINRVTHKEQLFADSRYNPLLFAAVVTLSLVSNRKFQAYMIRTTNDFLFDVETNILRKVRSASYESFQQIGPERVYTTLGDVKTVSQVPQLLTSAFNAAAIVVCGLGYMAWTSPTGSLVMVAMMALLLVVYLVRNGKIEKKLNELRNLQNSYHRYLRDLLLGFREIKISTRKSNRIYSEYLYKNRLEGKQLTVTSSVDFLNNELLGTYSWYIILGLVMFVLPAIEGWNNAQATTFITALLFLMGPVATLVSVIPAYSKVKIALQRIMELQREIAEPPYAEQTLPAAKEKFDGVRFEEVIFEYFDKQKKQTFSVGPLSIDIPGGEIIFITGGNGSGKSTFVNLLTGLYKPTSGNLFFNHHPLGANNYPQYSNSIAAIFANSYVFRENYEGYDLTPANTRLHQYLHLLNLTDVVRIDQDTHSIETNLSQGQLKRLAMVYALMEEKQLVVLDEWAAEQDPENKHYFYNCLLYKLKALGKTVVAVTHDDAFFHLADRVIRFEYGRIVSDRSVGHTAGQPAVV